jgi:N6-L-threonylcarbamoyladenine synthase
MGGSMDDSKAVVLGVDTSAYTTSAALFDGRRVVREVRRLLPVPAGQRGLRPSQAVFLHLRHLPDVLAEVLTGHRPLGVAVSVKPRPAPDSYLPPFQAGETAARAVALALGVPVWETTHQEGHLAAGLLDAGGPSGDWFWAIHISGGTTELLRVERFRGRLAVTVKGETSDLYAGQLVDRVGVALGLPFPAGPALEELSETARDRVLLPVGAPRREADRVTISFSGPEAAALRAIQLGADPSAVARGVEECLARALTKWVEAACKETGPLLVVGGVAANRRLRRLVADRLGPAWPTYWASPERSRDNAAGVARLGWEALVEGAGG